MNEIEFNLLNEPWIRVMDSDCKIKEVSLKDALLNAHEYKALKGEMPTQDIVILRLMLAVVHTVFSRVDIDGDESELEDADDAVDRWKSLWNNKRLPERPVTEYLEKWRDRFWLFHPERPFGQMAGLDTRDYDVQKLNGEVLQSDHKERVFSPYSGDEKHKMTFAQSARWLMALNGFTDMGTKKPNPKKPGWLADIGTLYVVGENLFETMMLNYVPIYPDGECRKECPIWEKDQVVIVGNKLLPVPDNRSELFTALPRKVLLIKDDNCVKYFRVAAGDYFETENAFIEPMTAWKKVKDKKREIYLPFRHDSEKQLWREFSSILMQSENHDTELAEVVKWANFLCVNRIIKQGYVFSVNTIGLSFGDLFKSLVKHIYFDSLEMNAQILSDIGRAYREEIKFEISRCEELADKISRLAGYLYLSSGGTSGSKASPDKTYRSTRATAKSQLYYRLDLPFRSWLSSLDPESDNKQEKFEQWQDTAKRITLDLGRELVAAAGDAAMVGHMIDKTIYSAPKAYNSFLRDVSKIYQKI